MTGTLPGTIMSSAGRCGSLCNWAGTLLWLLLQHLDQGDGPLVFGIDETLERRRGGRIKAKGIYRDGVRSSGSHFVKASGLRWISLMWLTTIPWARRDLGVAFSDGSGALGRYYRKRGRTPKKLTDWARQIILQLRRWLHQLDSIGAMLSEGPAVFPRSTNALVGSHLLSFDCSSDCTESPLNTSAGVR